MNQNNQMNQMDLNAKIEEILNKYKAKEEEIKKRLYELEAQQKILEQNLEQQKEALRQSFGTDDIIEIQKIKKQYEQTLQELIQKIENTLSE